MRAKILWIILLFIPFTLFADDTPTKADAEAMVKEAVKFYKENGRDKFFNEVRSSTGKFHYVAGTKKGLYIFVYDEKGVVLAHGVRLELTGKNRWNDVDPAGKHWIQEWTDLVHKQGSGWIDYKEFNPVDKNQVRDKSSFVELVDGIIIGCGIYK